MSLISRERRHVLAALAVAAVACLGYVGGELFFLDGALGFPLDDSWIHLQFARNLASGDGLTYNPGEFVAGSTAPLWTALLSVLFLLPGPAVAWVKLLGISTTLAALYAVFVLGRELGLSVGLAAFACLLTALTSWIVWSAVSGMEIPLFILLSLWGIILHVRERGALSSSSWALPVLALSILARPEGALLFVLAAVDRLLVWRRSSEGLALELGSWRAVANGCLAGAVLVVPVAILNWSFSGSLLPTTFAAKSGGMKGLLPNLRYIYEVMSIFVRSQPYMLFLSLGGVLVLAERLGTRRDRGLLPGLWMVALPLAYSTLGSPWTALLAGNFGRYYYPLFPLIVVLGTLALSRAAEAIGPRLAVGRASLPLRGIIVLLVLWPTVSAAVLGAGSYLQSVGNIEDGDVRMAEWLEPRLDPNAVLAVNDVGALKYLLPNRVVDLAGIIHPRVARYVAEARESGQDWRQGVLRILDETKPDYLVIFPGWYPGLEQLNSGFAPLYELEIQANIALGESRIVLYKTPWTRFPLREVPGAPGQESR